MPHFEFEFTKINLNLLLTVVGFLGTWLFFGFGIYQDVETLKKGVEQHRKEIAELTVATRAQEAFKATMLVDDVEMRTKIDNLSQILLRMEQRQFEQINRLKELK